MASRTVKKALPDREEARTWKGGTVKRALPERETAKPKKQRGKVKRALPVSRTRSR
jgi:hypothetical protein